MLVEQKRWGNIPLLHVYSNDMDDHAPTVIFLHGFMSAKEHNLHYAYQLVQKGVRVILPDAKWHGERSENFKEAQMNVRFWEIVLQSIHEVGLLAKALQDHYTPQGIGVAGTSMGGIVTAGCIKRYDWLQTAAICMGAPSFVQLAAYQLQQFAEKGIDFHMSAQEIAQTNELLAQYDVAFTPEKFANRAVFFWHGKLDKTVPFADTYHFYEQLQQRNEGELQFMVDENTGHAVSREGMLAATDWLAQHLA
ncbi:prolyl oligopeptidase family serine peptidase [Lysinibacillus piscis]|uniref:Esterase YitV n=1 Tax=Lysinibacillus piscis TaxID=2518931 RepID=A0ABQ5NI07_9BACI|nr:prolyl oligopeptidase family serine peptidase [Lysinibacillus sp. KH24]GLC87753.1 putative esterase YitV [Lysinibacillus sp. KH24]